MPLPHHYYPLIQRLKSLRRRYCAIHFTEMFVYLCAAASLEMLFFSGITAWWRPSFHARIVLLIFATMLSVVILFVWFKEIWRLYTTYRGSRGLLHLAFGVGRQFSTIRDRLGNALTLVMVDSKNMLSQYALDQIWQQAKLLDWNFWLRQEVGGRQGRQSASIAIVIISIFLFGHTFFSNGIKWLVHPSFKIPTPYSLHIQTDSTWTVRNDTVRVKLYAHGRQPEKIDLEIRENGSTRKIDGLKYPFETNLIARYSTLELRASAGRICSQWYNVEVHEYPMVRSLRVKLHPPAYTRLKSYALSENQGHVEALPGTVVEVDIESNKNLAGSSLLFESGRTMDLKINTHLGSGRFRVDSSDTYRVRLVDSLGLENQKPIRYNIKAKSDLYPTARIISPQNSIDLDERMQVDLELHATDDYGISGLRLGYSLIQPGRTDSIDVQYLVLSADSSHGTSMWVRMAWAVDTLGLLPGDAVAFFFEARDNDKYAGPKCVQSYSLIARFPSMDEIFAEMDARQDDVYTQVEEMLEEGRQVSRDMQHIMDKIRTGQELAWEEERQLESAQKAHAELQKRRDSIEENLSEMAESMDARQLAELETLEKYRKIQELFQSIDSPKLAAAAERLQKVMDQGDAAQLESALEDYRLDLEAMQEILDRTLNLLRRAVLEQRLDALIHQVESLAEAQESLNNEKDSELAQASIDVQKSGVQAAEREMNDLTDAMDQVEDVPSGEMSNAANLQSQRDLDSLFSEQTAAIEQQNSQEAQSAGQEIMNDLCQWAKDLQDVRDAMQGKEKKRIKEAFARYQDRLMSISKMQESLTQAVRQKAMAAGDAAPKQQALANNLAQLTDSLVAMMRQSFFVPPKILQHVGAAGSSMDKAVNQMGQSGKSNPAMMGKALGSLNRSLLGMESMQDGPGEGSSGSAMSELMSGLDAMTREQQAIQRQTLDLANQGGLSPGQQASARRMAGEQRALKEQLKSMMQEYGSNGGVQGRLDQLRQEMEAVARDLENAMPSRKTVQREQRIISRLLEAQHAMRERDHSRRREAGSGVDFQRNSPDAIRLQRNIMNIWQAQIMELQNSGYSEDYKTLIRHYFKAMMSAAASSGASQ
ncbi:hypothetical protein KAR48_06770 [bacterium]|nr:hypothetical protein [bacterium]